MEVTQYTTVLIHYFQVYYIFSIASEVSPVKVLNVILSHIPHAFIPQVISHIISNFSFS